MKVSFDQDPDLNPDDIEVLIKAARLSPAVLQLLQQIQQLSDNRPTLPLMTSWQSKSTVTSSRSTR